MYTKIVIGMSNFMRDYFIFLAVIIVAGVVFLVRYAATDQGARGMSELRLKIPFVGDVYQKLFLSRIADNIATMLRSGIQMVHSLEVTATVVGDRTMGEVLTKVVKDVESGVTVSDAMRGHKEFPGMFVAMVKIGEETGDLSKIMDTMAKFYRREVNNAIDTLVGLIEPIMIVSLAVGVAFLLSAVLIPIYNISAGL
jgi:type II secretory pathway component PulF